MKRLLLNLAIGMKLEFLEATIALIQSLHGWMAWTLHRLYDARAIAIREYIDTAEIDR